MTGPDRSERSAPIRRKGRDRVVRRASLSPAGRPASRPPRPDPTRPTPEDAHDEGIVRSDRPAPANGWLIVARKEFADHLLSVRFGVMLFVLGLAAIVPLYFAAERIRSLASDISGAQTVFLALFTVGPGGDNPLFPAVTFVAIVAPLLGVAFAFDAVNSERAEGTLARLVSQPIHRDDVINGKFVAGLAAILLVLTLVVAVISAFGIFRLGITPRFEEIVRVVAWVLVTAIYVSLWLAFGLLLSVVLRRAATSALIGFGMWIVVVIFVRLITETIGKIVAPLTTATTYDELFAANNIQEFITRLSPHQLYGEAATALLNPDYVGSPTNLAQATQASVRLPTILGLDQSILVVWPQVVILVGLTVACFALAYARFMRQEIRS